MPLDHLADPAAGLEKGLEMVFYLGVARVAGALSDREARHHVQLRVALEEQCRLTRELARASRLSALGELVAGIAHEIKNPLHALAGTAEVVDHLIPAFKAVGSGGRVEISVGICGEGGRRRATLQVDNDGPGIPAEDLERIFDPFTSGHAEGSGLGLSVASRIASSHGGYLTAENAGIGVRFTLLLPLPESS